MPKTITDILMQFNDLDAAVAKYNVDHDPTIRQEFTDRSKEVLAWLKNLFSTDSYHLSFNIGQARMTYVPYWIVKSKKFIERTPKNGFYIAIFLHSNGEKLSLSLNQGISSRPYSSNEYRMISQFLREECGFKVNNYTAASLDFGDVPQVPKRYESSHIIGYTYNVARGFNENQFISEFLSLSADYDTLLSYLKNISLDLDAHDVIYRKLINKANDRKNSLLAENIIISIQNQMTNSLTNEDSDFTSETDDHTEEITLEKRNLIPNAFPDSLSEKDYLGRNNLTRSVAALLACNELSTPFSIGVFAPWGHGKSNFVKHICDHLKIMAEENKNYTHRTRQSKSLLRILKRAFRKNISCSDDNECLVFRTIKHISFDASSYSCQEKVWASIYSKMYNIFMDDCGFWGDFSYRIYTIKEKYSLKRIGWPLLLISIYEVIVTLCLKIPSIKSVLAITPLLAIAFSSAKSIWSVFLKETNPSSKYESYQDFRDVVIDDINRLVKVWSSLRSLPITDVSSVDIENETYRLRFLLCIDELDRCPESKILETIQALQLFQNIDNLFTLIALDYKVICEAIGKTLKTEQNDTPFLAGERYLQKYISLPIFLNVPAGDEYIRQLLSKVTYMNNQEHHNSGTIAGSSNTSAHDSDGVDDEELHESDLSLDEKEYELTDDESNTSEGVFQVYELGKLSKTEEDHLKQRLSELLKSRAGNPRIVKRICNIVLVAKTLDVNNNLDFNLFVDALCEKYSTFGISNNQTSNIKEFEDSSITSIILRNFFYYDPVMQPHNSEISAESDENNPNTPSGSTLRTAQHSQFENNGDNTA